jgi:phosphate starvation-inducible PhoH-like protein
MSKKEKKKDLSPRVFQTEKLGFDLTVNPFPWTEKQQKFIDVALDKETSYILCEAPPGVGKTLLSVYIALKLLQERRVSSAIYVRNPIESSSKGLGFLKGEFDEKMQPYIEPLLDHLNELLPPAQISRILKENFIKGVPVGFLKGRTFNASLIIADEIEDLSMQEFLLVMGRLGKFSKMIMIGDNAQSNIKNSGFNKVYKAFDNEESRSKGIYCFKFGSEDILRNKILTYIVETFQKLN